MSTAGKVLVVLVMMFALVWMLLAGGVAQLNRNGNQALQKLSDDLEKVQAGLETAKHEIKQLRTETTLVQEKIDRDIVVLQSKQNDLEKARSEIQDTLASLQYQLASEEDTIKRGRETIEARNADHRAEEKAMDSLRTEVQELIADNRQLMDRLQLLRDQFRKTHRKNVEMIDKK